MPQALRIAVLSDTHNRLPHTLAGQIESADEIWHLGDVCSPDTLTDLKALDIPLQIVQGNCDPYFHWQSQLSLERNGCRFQLQHLPPRDASPSLTALLFGHMHYPIRDRIGDVPILNPGAITGPRNQSQSSFAWLNIDSEGEWTWEIEPLL